MKLITEHLTLESFDLHKLETYLEQGRDALAEHLNVIVPPSWPWEEVAKVIPWFRDQLAEDAGRDGWLSFLIIHREAHALIGDAGFAGPPDASGTVQIGYDIIPEYQRHGYGFEATRALVDYAFGHPAVQTIIAETHPDGEASIRIVEKLGMQKTVSTGDAIRWRLLRSEYRK